MYGQNIKQRVPTREEKKAKESQKKEMTRSRKECKQDEERKNNGRTGLCLYSHSQAPKLRTQISVVGPVMVGPVT